MNQHAPTQADLEIKSAPRSASASRSISVVKLGGSLARGRTLGDWLVMLAAEGRGRAVVVPGGGPFADQVRAMQAGCRFDDTTAHHMALLAMEQYAVMLRGMEPSLLPVLTVRDARRAVKQGRTALWMPTALALAECALPRSWDTTSDSLAAWFATQVQANDLILVKSVQLVRQAASARSLQRDGIVDRLFPELIAHSHFTTRLFGSADAPRLQALWRGADEGVVVRSV